MTTSKNICEFNVIKINENKHTKVKDSLIITNAGEKTEKTKTEKHKIVKIHF